MDTTYPVALKNFAFGFETTDLHNLLNFEYSLINDQGKLLESKQGEDKTLALNFTIQIIWDVESKKKTIRNPKNKSQKDDLTELRNDIKNSIKKLYISDQKKKKTINEYAELLTKIRNEYAKLLKENNETKI